MTDLVVGTLLAKLVSDREAGDARRASSSGTPSHRDESLSVAAAGELYLAINLLVSRLIATRLEDFGRAIGWASSLEELHTALALCEPHCSFVVTFDGLIVSEPSHQLSEVIAGRVSLPAPYTEFIEELDRATLHRLDAELLDAILFDAMRASVAEVSGERLVTAFGTEHITDRLTAVLCQYPEGAHFEKVVQLYSETFAHHDDQGAILAFLTANKRFECSSSGLWRLRCGTEAVFQPTGHFGERHSADFDLPYAIVRLLMVVVKADDVILSQEEEVIVTFFRTGLGYAEAHMPSVRRMIEQARDEDTDVDQLVGDLVSADEALRELLLDTATEVALADGYLHPSEELMLLELVERLELGPVATKRVLNELQRDQNVPPTTAADFLKILGLPIDASPISARVRYRQVLDQINPDKLAHHGTEFAQLAERRRTLFQLAFEKLQSDSSYWNHRALCPPLASVGLSEFDFSVIYFQWFGLLRVRTLADLVEKDSEAFLRLPDFLDDNWISLCQTVRSRYPELCDSDPKLRRFLGSRAEALGYLIDRVVELLDVAEIPLKQHDLEARLFATRVKYSNKELIWALEHAHRDGRIFFCENKKWANPRHLSMNADEATQIRNLALRYLNQQGGNGKLRCSELEWRKEAGWAVSPVRVDFVLSADDRLHKIKPGVYRLATVQPTADDILCAPLGPSASQVGLPDSPPVMRPKSDFLNLPLLGLVQSPKLTGFLCRKGIFTIGDLQRRWCFVRPVHQFDGQKMALLGLFQRIAQEAEIAGLESETLLTMEALLVGDNAHSGVQNLTPLPGLKTARAVLNSLDVILPETLRAIVLARCGFPGELSQQLGPELSLASKRVKILEQVALKKLAANDDFKYLHSQLHSDLSKADGWRKTEHLPSVTWDLDPGSLNCLIRLLAKVFPEISFQESPSVVTCEADRLRVLQEAKFLAKESNPVPVEVAQLVFWLQERLQLSRTVAERVVIDLWGLSICDDTLNGGKQKIVYAYDSNPTLEQSLAAILYLNDGGPKNAEELAKSLRDSFNTKLGVTELRDVLLAAPLTFFRQDTNAWRLRSSVDLESLRATLLSDALLFLWVARKPVQAKRLLELLFEDAAVRPIWLTDCGLVSILSSDSRFGVLDGEYVQPTNANFYLRANRFDQVCEIAVVRDASSSGYTTEPGTVKFNEENIDEQCAGAKRGLEEISREALVSVASWCNDHKRSLPLDQIGALLLIFLENQHPIHSSSEITFSERFQGCMEAYRSLLSLNEQHVILIGTWWRARVGSLSHQRLAELVFNAAKGLRSAKKSITAQLRVPQEQLFIDEKSLDSPAFFSSQRLGHTISLTLNTNHPMFPVLKDALSSLEGQAVKLLLAAWATYEQDQPEGARKERAGEARLDWGRVSRRLIRSTWITDEPERNEGGLRTEALVDSSQSARSGDAGQEIQDRDAARLRAARLYEQGQISLAEQIYTQLLINSPNVEDFSWRAFCRLETQHFALALEDFNSAIDIETHDPESYNGRGVCFMRLGRHHQAIEDFRRAVGYDREWPVYQLNLVRALFAAGHFAEARDRLASVRPLCDDTELSMEAADLSADLERVR